MYTCHLFLFFGMCISVMECFIYPPLWERTISNGISPGCIHASQSQSHVRHLTSWEKTWRFHSASIWAIDDLLLPLWVPAAHRSRFKPFQTHNLATTKANKLRHVTLGTATAHDFRCSTADNLNEPKTFQWAQRYADKVGLSTMKGFLRNVKLHVLMQAWLDFLGADQLW